MKGTQGQLKKISIILVLVLLLTVVILTAEEALPEITPTQETQTSDVEQSVILPSAEEVIDKCLGIICDSQTLQCNDGFVASCSNNCNSETGECGSCIADCAGHDSPVLESNETSNQVLSNENSTQNTEDITSTDFIGQNESMQNNTNTNPTNSSTERNATMQNVSEIIPADNSTPLVNQTSPSLEINLIYPSRIIRGQIVELEAIVTNNGNAQANNSILQWDLADIFQTNESLTKDCGSILPGDFCNFKINVSTSVSTPLGKNQIKILVNYEYE